MTAPVDRSVLEDALGVTLRNPALLDLALTHRSFAFEAGGLPTNERLEFLGDAVLGLVVADLLYRRYPAEPEGRLAKFRAAAVNTVSLADIGRALRLGTHIRLGRGEEQSGGRDKNSILADTVEALIGAAYLDQGMAAAERLITRLFGDLLHDIATQRESLDYKTSLQELTAARQAGLPRYEVSESGPDHQKQFTAVVTIGGAELGRGEGRSKKEAEQRAARQAFGELRQRAVPSPADPPPPDGDRR